MYTDAWTSHLKTDEEKKRFVFQMHGASEVLERLQGLIDLKMKELETSERSIKAYASPDWSHLQAHKNGYASALTVLKNLLNLDQQTQ